MKNRVVLLVQLLLLLPSPSQADGRRSSLLPPGAFGSFVEGLRARGIDPSRLRVVDRLTLWNRSNYDAPGQVALVYDGKQIGSILLRGWAHTGSGKHARSMPIGRMLKDHGEVSPAEGRRAFVYPGWSQLEGVTAPGWKHDEARGTSVAVWPRGRRDGAYGGKGLGTLLYIVTAKLLRWESGALLASGALNPRSEAVWRRLARAGYAERRGDQYVFSAAALDALPGDVLRQLVAFTDPVNPRATPRRKNNPHFDGREPIGWP